MEFAAHLFIWCLAVLYSLYSLFLFTKRVDNSIKNLTEDFEDGWPILGRLKDVSDYEWKTWKHFLITLTPWLVLHFCGAECLRQNNYCTKKWYIFVSSAFILWRFGLKYFLLLSIQPVLFLSVLHFNGKLKSVWVTSCFTLIIINVVKIHYENNNSLYNEHKDANHENEYMILVAIFWIHLRSLSFSFEKLTKSLTKENVSITNNVMKSDTVNMFSYIYYLPLFFLGPVILYNDFQKSFNTPYKTSLNTRIIHFLRNIIRFAGWFLFIEFSLHFIYFNALQYYTEMVIMMPDWCLYGSGLWMGLYFYMKYLVIYGLSGTLTTLDHIKPEPPPRCIARVHRYSQMWKYFDVGLHKFLIRYIYKPAIEGIDRKNLIWLSLMRALASLFCFTFVFFWHGAHGFILIWTILNYLGIVIESVGTTLSHSAFYTDFKVNVLKTEVMNSRFSALLSTPVLIISAISNFYFFAGFEVGNIYAQRVVNQSFGSFIVMFICLYSSCRVSQRLNNVSARNILT